MDEQNLIGANNDLPWHLPNDLKFFKEKTTGHTIIMGRKTYEAIGRPLPNRNNIVITRGDAAFPDEVTVIHDINPILKWNEEYPDEEYFVIGGATIFEQVLPYADRMYITLIKDTFEGDTYFPPFSAAEWTVTTKEKGKKDAKNPYNYYFIQYDRKG